jgi:uncharacterized repeat protein (TIGR02543 family)
MEKPIIFLSFIAVAALLALFAQGTRIILERGRLRLTLRRFLPWLLWAAMVATVVLVTLFAAFGGLLHLDSRAGAFFGDAGGSRVPTAAPEAPRAPSEAPEEEREREYLLSFETGDGDPMPAYAAKAGASVSLPRLPDEKGRRFTGWYADRALTEPIQSVTMDASKTVYAGWLPTLDTTEHRAYMLGYANGDFRPGEGISRAETLVMFARLLEEPAAPGGEESRFSDIRDGAWYAEVLRDMERYSIIRGYPEGDFRPDAHISRAEFVSICVRLAEKKEDAEKAAEAAGRAGAADESGAARVLADCPAGHWAYGVLKEAAERGWFEAYARGGPVFAPDERITRAEAVTIVNRMLSRRADEAYIRAHGLAGFRDVPPDTWAYLDIMEASRDHGFEIVDGSERWSLSLGGGR